MLIVILTFYLLGIFTSTLRLFFNLYLCAKQYPPFFTPFSFLFFLTFSSHSTSQRTRSNTYLTVLIYLKTHLEAFFTALLCRIVDNKTTSYEQQELALECLVEFCRLPYLMADI